MNGNLFGSCVYTIISPEKFRDAAAHEGPTTFTESKAWVTAARLLEEADHAGLKMPVLFGDATKCSRLLGWGVLEQLTVGEGTEFVVRDVRPLRRHSTQELVLKSTRKKIAPGFIRPYALCVTPSFLK
jgi:hypothetical protein